MILLQCECFIEERRSFITKISELSPDMYLLTCKRLGKVKKHLGSSQDVQIHHIWKEERKDEEDIIRGLHLIQDKLDRQV